MEITDKEGIEAIVRQFYSTLYSAMKTDAKQIREYPEVHWEVKIVKEQQKCLNATFTPMEIKEALKHQKKGKTPGLDVPYSSEV